MDEHLLRTAALLSKKIQADTYRNDTSGDPFEMGEHLFQDEAGTQFKRGGCLFHRAGRNSNQ